MSVAPACYGRRGPQASGNHQVAELLERTVDGQHRATVAFLATLESLKAQGLVPWTGPVGHLTLLVNQWITMLAWERATVFLDAAIAMDPSLSDNAYRLIDGVCDEAATLSLHSIQMQAEVAQGRRPGNASIAPLPSIPGGPSSAPMLWASLEAVYSRVRADLNLIAQLGVPSRLGKVQRILLESYLPKAQQFDYLASQWRKTTDVGNQVQIVRQAIPLAQHLYTVGQQIWAPYLAGPAYIGIARTMPLFAGLNLPFDPWILTDPAEVDKRVVDRASCEQLIAFWKTVASPSAAMALHEDIATALAAESITILPGKALKIAPWQPQYHVLYTVSINQQELQAGAIFRVYPRAVSGKRSLEIQVVTQA
jgi:hypothetical protein